MPEYRGREGGEVEDLQTQGGQTELPVYGEIGDLEIARPREAHLKESHRYPEA